MICGRRVRAQRKSALDSVRDREKRKRRIQYNPVKPPAFEYVRPSSLDEAVRLLADPAKESKVLAGGQSLIPLLNFRLAYPRRLVDIKGIAELAYIRRDGDRLRIGATTRTRDIEESDAVAAALPLLTEACHWVGHVQIRNRGTIGGSLAHADPSAELPAVCVLLDAELKVRGSAGTRTTSANGFFHGFLSTDLAPDEILEEVAFTIPAAGTRWGFREFAHRRGDFALAGAACTLRLNRDGVVEQAVALVFGATPSPRRSAAAAAMLHGNRVTNEAIREAAQMTRRELASEPAGDSEQAYRQELCEVMLVRALTDAVNEGASRGVAA